mgnify:CR=1
HGKNIVRNQPLGLGDKNLLPQSAGRDNNRVDEKDLCRCFLPDLCDMHFVMRSNFLQFIQQI